jgi:NDP-sugar pyrophosphorylase family protein
VIHQAVLLLGGRGTRLWPLTDRRPKGLLPVAGLPFFEYQVRLLRDVGVEEIFLAVSRNVADAWSAHLAGRPDLVHVRLAVEDEALDTAGPVRALLDRLEGPFLTLNGDVLFDADLADVVARAPDSGATLVLTKVDDPSAFGVVVTDEAGRVVEFVEKPPEGEAPADTVSAGIYLLTPEALAPFPEGPLSMERVVFPSLAEAGRLHAIVTEGSWFDIGSSELYVTAHGYVISGVCRVHVPEPGTEHGPGRLAGKVKGFAWVGEGAVVEEGATVEDGIVLPGATVRSGATVSRSVIGWGADVAEGAEVSAFSLVGEEASVGPRCEVRGIRVAPGVKLPERAVTVRPPQ